LQNQRKSTGLSPGRTRGRVEDCHFAEPEEEYGAVILQSKGERGCNVTLQNQKKTTVILQNQMKCTGLS
jgi:hypothetical protein